ncbi:MAG: hypothetical protein GX612_06705 [Bacteroidales bacterium]|nr:hypothetical protein [Bacteroidales bacterium]
MNKKKYLLVIGIFLLVAVIAYALNFDNFVFESRLNIIDFIITLLYISCFFVLILCNTKNRYFLFFCIAWSALTLLSSVGTLLNVYYNMPSWFADYMIIPLVVVFNMPLDGLNYLFENDHRMLQMEMVIGLIWLIMSIALIVKLKRK